MKIRTRLLLMVLLLMVGSLLILGLMVVFPLRAYLDVHIYYAAFATLFLVMISGVAALWFSWGITTPLSKMKNMFAGVQAAEYDPEELVDVCKRSDELGEFSRAFDQMAREVVAREKRLEMLRKVIPIGVSLSAEKDFNRLLETIVIQAQTITRADGGTLYLLEEKNRLRFFIMRNSSLNVAMGGTTGAPIPFAPLKLYGEDGKPNHHHVATHVALTRERINIADAYETGEFDFSGTKAFDKTTGYRSKSFLTFPLMGEGDEVIGVIQLINSIDSRTGEVAPFVSDEVLETLILLASTALVAYIRQESLRKEIERLNIAIDEKKRSSQVDEITDTDYFRSLLTSVKKFRQSDDKEEKTE